MAPSGRGPACCIRAALCYQSTPPIQHHTAACPTLFSKGKHPIRTFQAASPCTLSPFRNMPRASRPIIVGSLMTSAAAAGKGAIPPAPSAAAVPAAPPGSRWQWEAAIAAAARGRAGQPARRPSPAHLYVLRQQLQPGAACCMHARLALADLSCKPAPNPPARLGLL